MRALAAFVGKSAEGFVAIMRCTRFPLAMLPPEDCSDHDAEAKRG
jgi:hypothetical protein